MRRDSEAVHLTPIEFDLLRVLVRNRGRLLTHRALLREVWGPGYEEDIQPLRTHIARLRAKIEPAGDLRAAADRHRAGRRLPVRGLTASPTGRKTAPRRRPRLHEIVMRAGGIVIGP